MEGLAGGTVGPAVGEDVVLPLLEQGREEYQYMGNCRTIRSVASQTACSAATSTLKSG